MSAVAPPTAWDSDWLDPPDSKGYVRHDFPEGDGDEEARHVEEELHRLGYEWDDEGPCVEHDCVSGTVRRRHGDKADEVVIPPIPPHIWPERWSGALQRAIVLMRKESHMQPDSEERSIAAADVDVLEELFEVVEFVGNFRG